MRVFDALIIFAKCTVGKHCLMQDFDLTDGVVYKKGMADLGKKHYDTHPDFRIDQALKISRYLVWKNSLSARISVPRM